jgi:N-acetylglutamate synthase-like GNAT family acetyltransferase
VKVVVRRLRAADAADLGRSCYPDQPLKAVQDYADWCVAQMERGLLVRLVVEVDGRVVANGQLTLQGAQAEIGSLVVGSRYRSKGIGRQLLRALVAEARRQGIPSLVLTVSVLAPAVRAWYEREGFACTGERTLPRDERVWVMEMPLDSSDCSEIGKRAQNRQTSPFLDRDSRI